MSTAGAAPWDKEYAGGRYRHEPPVAFVADILAAARRGGLASGLYIGCGNGRNYEPLVRGGLDLTGLDISDIALRQLSAQMPELRGLFATGFEPVMALRAQITRRQPPETGQWTQWEGIWRASE